MPFIETSAKASLNVDEAFVTMTKEIKDKMAGNQKTPAAKTPGSLGQGKSLARPATVESSTTVEDNTSAVQLKAQTKPKNKGYGGCC